MLFVTCVNRNGPSPRILFASLSMTARSAPTSKARSVLLMMSRSDCVMPGPPFARNLVSAGHVDDVDRVIRQFAAELRGEIVAAALDEQQLRPQRFHQHLERDEVRGDVVANGRVRTASGLDGANALGRQRVMPHQKFGIFPGEDIVGHDAQLMAIAKLAAQREKQRRLAAADRPADADGKRSRADSREPCGRAADGTRPDWPGRRGRAARESDERPVSTLGDPFCTLMTETGVNTDDRAWTDTDQ